MNILRRFWRALGNPIDEPEERWKFYKQRRCRLTIYCFVHWVYIAYTASNDIKIVANENRVEEFPSMY